MPEQTTETHPSEEELRIRLEQERADEAARYQAPEEEEPEPEQPNPETDADEPEEPESYAQRLQAIAGGEPPPDPGTLMCPICRGWGIVQTGSLVDVQRTRGCQNCGGVGWVDQAMTVPPPPPPVARKAPEPEPFIPDFMRQPA